MMTILSIDTGLGLPIEPTPTTANPLPGVLPVANDVPMISSQLNAASEEMPIPAEYAALLEKPLQENAALGAALASIVEGLDVKFEQPATREKPASPDTVVPENVASPIPAETVVPEKSVIVEKPETIPTVHAMSHRVSQESLPPSYADGIAEKPIVAENPVIVAAPAVEAPTVEAPAREVVSSTVVVEKPIVAEAPVVPEIVASPIAAEPVVPEEPVIVEKPETTPIVHAMSHRVSQENLPPSYADGSAEKSVVVEAPAREVVSSTVVAEKPVVAERLVVVETPIVEEKPVAVETPVIVERPVVLETPVIAAMPAAKSPAREVVSSTVVVERPVVVEHPVIEEPSAVIESPVVPEKSVVVERPETIPTVHAMSHRVSQGNLPPSHADGIAETPVVAAAPAVETPAREVVSSTVVEEKPIVIESPVVAEKSVDKGDATLLPREIEILPATTEPLPMTGVVEKPVTVKAPPVEPPAREIASGTVLPARKSVAIDDDSLTSAPATAMPQVVEAPVVRDAQSITTTEAPEAVSSVARPDAPQAASHVSAELVAIASEVAETMLVTPSLLSGQGEVRVQLKPDVLSGSEVRIAVQGRELTVEFAPTVHDAAVFIERNLPQLTEVLSSRITVFNVSVAVKGDMRKSSSRI